MRGRVSSQAKTVRHKAETEQILKQIVLSSLHKQLVFNDKEMSLVMKQLQ